MIDKIKELGAQIGQYRERGPIIVDPKLYSYLVQYLPQLVFKSYKKEYPKIGFSAPWKE